MSARVFRLEYLGVAESGTWPGEPGAPVPGLEPGQRFTLSDETLVFYRKDARGVPLSLLNHPRALAVDDASVDWREGFGHCAVWVRNGAVLVRDSNTTYGTWISDGDTLPERPLPEGKPVPLAPGQQLWVGRLRFRLLADALAEEAPPPLPPERARPAWAPLRARGPECTCVVFSPRVDYATLERARRWLGGWKLELDGRPEAWRAARFSFGARVLEFHALRPERPGDRFSKVVNEAAQSLRTRTTFSSAEKDDNARFLRSVEWVLEVVFTSALEVDGAAWPGVVGVTRALGGRLLTGKRRWLTPE
ncbi:FHA domain-containing protein [Myxococcaceae bacterium GXIMD 01537]